MRQVYGIISVATVVTALSTEPQSLNGVRGRERELAITRSTEFCYENDNFLECWNNKPVKSNIPLCDLNSGSTTCYCKGGSMCDVHSGSTSNDFEAAYCQEKKCYVPRDDERDTECFCSAMEKLPEFPRRGSRKSTQCGSSWWKWGCCLFKSGYAWKDGKCQDKTRFMNEKCWDGGECKNGNGDAKVSCYENKCYPTASVQKRAQCECDWIGWNFLFACSSSETCDGHACVWNTGNGNKYCDYSTDQNW